MSPRSARPPPLAARVDVGDIDDEAFGAGAAPAAVAPATPTPTAAAASTPTPLGDDGDTDPDGVPAVELDPAPRRRRPPRGPTTPTSTPTAPGAPGRGVITGTPVAGRVAEPVPIDPEGDARGERLADLLADVDVLVQGPR